jgi:hypothetical protein
LKSPPSNPTHVKVIVCPAFKIKLKPLRSNTAEPMLAYVPLFVYTMPVEANTFKLPVYDTNGVVSPIAMTVTPTICRKLVAV